MSSASPGETRPDDAIPPGAAGAAAGAVLVTGAASGIGAATAIRLAGAGRRVLLLDRDADGLARTVQACGDTAVGRAVDLTRPDEVQTVVRELAAVHDIGAVVTVAGGVRGGDVITTDDETWQWNLDVNAASVFHVCRAVLPLLVARGSGAVVTFGSLTALRPMPGRAAYAAAKGAVIAFTQQLALEYGPAGISVNCICPGAVRTPLLAARFEVEPEAETALEQRIPLRRLGRPEEVAEVVELLVSRRAPYLTGQTLVIDGGQALG
ncbi:SDR family oxidoreductase [Nakamurella sp. YIM 132087]|uniref:SDR family oxidoreductase n=1 Tax=Nakamurella alba TaxID=2665158 RepID=A0A7K1FPE3_9ACTN|nr:SDR family oxidoreductase [Nakamurella alba]MTD15209.1 SDR family oxidoreductase [Nakamurella alba]